MTEEKGPINIQQYKDRLNKIFGRKTQFTDMVMDYIEASMFSLETDDFLPRQDTTIWAALDLFVGIANYQSDLDKDRKLTEVQREDLQTYLIDGNDKWDLVEQIIDGLPYSEVNFILTDMKELEDSDRAEGIIN